MKKNRIPVFIVFKVLLSILIFNAAVYFESPHSSRFYILVSILAAYIIISVLRNYIKHKLVFIITYIIEIILIYLLEYNSKYLINYFFHCYYIVLILESSLYLPRRKSMVIGAIALVISLTKYALLLYYSYSYANVSEMAFLILVGILILVIINFSQYYREEKEKKDLLYNELLNTHRKLREYADKIQRLTIMEERNRIARDIHDSLGHIMTGIIMELEIAGCILNEDKYRAKELIEDTKKSAREGLIKIREVVDTLKVNEDKFIGIEPIKELVNNFSRKINADIKLNIQGNIVKLNPILNVTLYRIVQEALTNSVRHGKAERIEVVIEFTKDKLKFKIEDNGKGVSDIKTGFGLESMKERVKSLFGQISFISELDKGFTVEGFFPLEVNLID